MTFMPLHIISGCQMRSARNAHDEAWSASVKFDMNAARTGPRSASERAPDVALGRGQPGAGLFGGSAAPAHDDGRLHLVAREREEPRGLVAIYSGRGRHDAARAVPELRVGRPHVDHQVVVGLAQ